ncbi:hypothetical protein HanIR_Chr07g0303231 [Helianthus annuus]|nr:hypothetical protein HanIR_Chr07g0303231 [Helianthus annuus]
MGSTRFRTLPGLYPYPVPLLYPVLPVPGSSSIPSIFVTVGTGFIRCKLINMRCLIYLLEPVLSVASSLICFCSSKLVVDLKVK